MTENVTLHRGDLLEVLRCAENELRELGAVGGPFSTLEKVTETIACVELSSNPEPDLKERMLRAVFSALDIKLAAELKGDVLHAGTALTTLMMIRDTVHALDPQLGELDFPQAHAAAAARTSHSSTRRMLEVSFQYVGPKNISWVESFALDDSGCLADNVIEKAVAAKLDLGFLELEADFINETDGLIYQNGFDVAIGEFFSREVDADAGKVCEVESVLQLLPEVTWDRWSGDVADNVSVFGWIPRDDGRADFVLVIIGQKAPWKGPWLFATSSALHSADFSKRLGFTNHSDCKRVEEHFPTVRCVKLNSEAAR